MRIAITLSMLVFLPCSVGWAAFTDFSDYPQSVSFDSDEIFQSNGLRFKSLDLYPYEEGRSGISVQTGSIRGPSYKLHPGPGVAFLLPTGTEEVSFTFSNGGGWAIFINEIEPSLPTDANPSFLDGATVAGVSIETDLSTQYPSFEEGLLTLKGPVFSLFISGIELSIDDVSVIVPEPSTAALLLAPCISLLAARRRRRVCLR